MLTEIEKETKSTVGKMKIVPPLAMNDVMTYLRIITDIRFQSQKTNFIGFRPLIP